MPDAVPGPGRGQPLLAWLRERIWPLEAAHDPDSLRASARLGIAELLLGGTTAVLDMGTVHHTDTLFETAAETGIRYTGGKALMDYRRRRPAGPARADRRRAAETAIVWPTPGTNAKTAGCATRYSPRFVLTATYDLLRSVGARARANHMLVHTHASEQRDETHLVRQRFGVPNIQLLANLGLAETNACFAHCVWPEPEEFDVLASGGASVVHCPSCNLKLGSGAAPIAEYLERGVNVALGADSAASNNRLDGWEELRLAGSARPSSATGRLALPAADLFEAGHHRRRARHRAGRRYRQHRSRQVRRPGGARSAARPRRWAGQTSTRAWSTRPAPPTSAWSTVWRPKVVVDDGPSWRRPFS